MEATRRATEMLGEAGAWGTIESGMRACLLILVANPLEDIRNTRTLETMVLSGDVVDRSTLLFSK